MRRQKTRHSNNERGFSLIEIMMATALTTIGLLAACQILLIAMGSATLARSQGTAVLSAMNKLEFLSESYSRDPENGNVLPGNHGPEETKVINPNDGSVLNRFQITWKVDAVADPRPGEILDARRVRVTVTPALAGGILNYQPPFNKILNVTTVFSPRMR
ncbi:MAG: type II secretion system protein [Acidobacteria bacterium]|nr:type II secretion system protein [Acidobacteriota bacterium]